MTLPKILQGNKKLEMFKKEGLLTKIENPTYLCICGVESPLSKINVDNDFYICPSCLKSRKFKKDNLKSRIIYEIKIDLLKKRMTQRVENIGLRCVTCFGQTHIDVNDSLIPLVVLEECEPSFLDPSQFSIIVYYHEQEARKVRNIYSEKRMIEAGEFLEMSEKKLKEYLSLHKTYKDHNEVQIIKEKIDLFASTNTDEDFEIEITKLFDLLRNKSAEMDKMLSFFNNYKNISVGRKPIHLGGTNRSDTEFINLFQYFNDLFNLANNKSADAKRYYLSHITRQTLTEKIESNYGKEIVLVTNTDKVDSAAWGYVWRSYKEHNLWKYFIIDLDLLSLVIYHLKLNKDLFNLQEKSILKP